MVDRAAEGRTMLLSSHLINEVERVADIVAILHDGRIRLIEPLDVLKHDTRIVTATMDDAHVESPEPRGEVWSRSVSGRQRRFVVGRLADDWRNEFTRENGVQPCDASVPSLEEIFIAVCEHEDSKTTVVS